MKRIGYAVAILLIFLAGLAAAIRPSMASAHDGSAGINCQSVGFSYVNFKDATNTVNESISIDGSNVYSAPFSFTGTSGSHSVGINPGPGTHTVSASANWNTNGESGSFSSSARVECGGETTTTTTTTPCRENCNPCPPGQHQGGKDGEPGNDATCVPDNPPCIDCQTTTTTTTPPPTTTEPPVTTTTEPAVTTTTEPPSTSPPPVKNKPPAPPKNNKPPKKHHPKPPSACPPGKPYTGTCGVQGSG